MTHGHWLQRNVFHTKLCGKRLKNLFKKALIIIIKTYITGNQTTYCTIQNMSDILNSLFSVKTNANSSFSWKVKVMLSLIESDLEVMIRTVLLHDICTLCTVCCYHLVLDLLSALYQPFIIFSENNKQILHLALGSNQIFIKAFSHVTNSCDFYNWQLLVVVTIHW